MEFWEYWEFGEFCEFWKFWKFWDFASYSSSGSNTSLVKFKELAKLAEPVVYSNLGAQLCVCTHGPWRSREIMRVKGDGAGMNSSRLELGGTGGLDNMWYCLWLDSVQSPGNLGLLGERALDCGNVALVKDNPERIWAYWVIMTKQRGYMFISTDFRIFFWNFLLFFYNNTKGSFYMISVFFFLLCSNFSTKMFNIKMIFRLIKKKLYGCCNKFWF